MINILKSLGTSHFVDCTRKSKVVILPIHTFHLLSLSVKKGFVKGEASRILRANSSKTTFEEIISNFEQRLIDRGYPQTMIKKPSIRYKVHREGVCTPETQQQRGKRNIGFCDTVPALSVYFKRSFNEKMEFYTKPTVTSPNF